MSKITTIVHQTTTQTSNIHQHHEDEKISSVFSKVTFENTIHKQGDNTKESLKNYDSSMTKANFSQLANNELDIQQHTRVNKFISNTSTQRQQEQASNLVNYESNIACTKEITSTAQRSQSCEGGRYEIQCALGSKLSNDEIQSNQYGAQFIQEKEGESLQAKYINQGFKSSKEHTQHQIDDLRLNKYSFASSSLKHKQFASSTGRVQLACDAAMQAALKVQEDASAQLHIGGWEMELRAQQYASKSENTITIKTRSYEQRGANYRLLAYQTKNQQKQNQCGDTIQEVQILQEPQQISQAQEPQEIELACAPQDADLEKPIMMPQEAEIINKKIEQTPQTQQNYCKQQSENIIQVSTTCPGSYRQVNSVRSIGYQQMVSYTHCSSHSLRIPATIQEERAPMILQGISFAGLQPLRQQIVKSEPIISVHPISLQYITVQPQTVQQEQLTTQYYRQAEQNQTQYQVVQNKFVQPVKTVEYQQQIIQQQPVYYVEQQYQQQQQYQQISQPQQYQTQSAEIESQQVQGVQYQQYISIQPQYYQSYIQPQQYVQVKQVREQQLVQTNQPIMRHSAFIQLTPTPLVPVNIFQSVPLIQQGPMYQSIIKVQQQQPPPQIVRQRPIHVVDLEQYDDLWRKKVEELEKQLKQLQNQKPQPVSSPEPVIELRAGADTEDLEKQISALQLELYKSKGDYEDLLQKYNESLSVQEELRQQIKNHICSDNTEDLKKIIFTQDADIERLKALLAKQQKPAPVVHDDSEQLKLYQERIAELEKKLQEAIIQMERFRQENSQFQSQLQYYKDQNNEKDETIEDLKKQIEELNAELDELSGEQEEIIESRVETIRTEIKNWKDKFLALNVQYHDQQEKLMLAEAELDHIKKQYGAKGGAQQVTTTTTTTTKK